MNQYERSAAFESLVQRVMEQEKAAGLCVSVFDANGNTLYEKLLGTRGEGKPVDGDTIFGLASVTKSFTCLAVLQLAERGVVELHAPVSRYLPEFTDKKVTVAHLMSHSAGYFPFPRILVGQVAADLGLEQPRDGDLAYSAPLAQEGGRRVIDRLNGVEARIGRPGEYFSYSNDSYALLSELIRRMGDQETYSAYLDKNILAPLGMTRSGCGFLWREKEENVSLLYRQSEDKMTETDDFTDNAFVLMGGGNMKSTVNDMKKYVTMYLNEGRGLPGGKAVVDEMIRPRMATGRNRYYCSGLSREPMGDLTLIGHGGSLTGVSSHMSWCPDTGIGVVVLCNTSGVSVAALARAAMAMACGAEEDRPPRQAVWSSERLDAACGRFVSGEGSTIEIVRRGEGLFLLLGEKDLPLFPATDRMLRCPMEFNDLYATLYTDQNGFVWSLGFGSRIVPRA